MSIQLTEDERHVIKNAAGPYWANVEMTLSQILMRVYSEAMFEGYQLGFKDGLEKSMFIDRDC